MVVLCLLLAGGVTWWWITQRDSAAEEDGDRATAAAAHDGAPGASDASGAGKSAANSGAAARDANYPPAPPTAASPGAATAAPPMEPRDARPPAPGLASALQERNLSPDTPEERRRFRYWYPCAPGAQVDSGDYEFWADKGSRITGTYSARISSLVATPSPTGAGFCQTFRADEYRGKRVAYSGHLRTWQGMPGAQLVIRADAKDGRIVALANMRGGVVPGNFDWFRHTLVLDIPENAQLIMVGAVLINTGSVWIDDVDLQVVDDTWPLTQPVSGAQGYSGTQPAVMANLPPRLQDGSFEVTYVKTDR